MKRIMILLGMIGLLSASSCGLIDDITGDDDPTPQEPEPDYSKINQEKAVREYDMAEILIAGDGIEHIKDGHNNDWPLFGSYKIRRSNKWLEGKPLYVFLMQAPGAGRDIDIGNQYEDTEDDVPISSMALSVSIDDPNDTIPADAYFIRKVHFEFAEESDIDHWVQRSPVYEMKKGAALIIAAQEGGLGWVGGTDPVQQIMVSVNPEALSNLDFEWTTVNVLHLDHVPLRLEDYPGVKPGPESAALTDSLRTKLVTDMFRQEIDTIPLNVIEIENSAPINIDGEHDIINRGGSHSIYDPGYTIF